MNWNKPFVWLLLIGAALLLVTTADAQRRPASSRATGANRRPPSSDAYRSAVRDTVRARAAAERRVDKSREWYAYQAGRDRGYRSGVVAGAVRNEIRREARRRYYRGRMIYRPHGHWYPGFGYYRDDSSAWKWLALTSITLKVLDNVNEAAQRRHEQAQVEATMAAINRPVYWEEGEYRGSVTATRQFRRNDEQCREFRQVVEIGGREEEAYGTACLQPDGAWQIVP